MALYHLCACPGCYAPVPQGEKYCNKHKAKGLASEERQRKLAEQRRLQRSGSREERGYTYKWRKLRDRFIAQHPHCEECLKHGKITLATDVDHIIPHRGDPKLLYDEGNLQSLCKSCHSRKTAKENGGFGNPKG